MRIQKGSLAFGEAKSVRWTLFSQWKNLWTCECTRLGVVVALPNPSSSDIRFAVDLLFCSLHSFPALYIITKTKGSEAMHYPNMVPGIFLARPNRFIAKILIDGTEETVHVKNTGRCRELLPAGAEE